MSGLRVTFVHDWLNGMRGGEKCLEPMLERYPESPIHALFYEPGKVSPKIAAHAVHTTFLQGWPGIFRHYRNYLPFFPAAVESIRPAPCDVVVSMSHCVAKSVRKPAGSAHLCYLFTPVRYAWCQFDEYFSGRDALSRAVIRAALERLKKWDRATAARVDRFVAISRHVAGRVRAFYGREAEVVYPPADTDFYTPDPSARREDFYLVVSALVPYKRVDLAVRAMTRMNRPLVVIGEGPERKNLEKIAGPNVRFLGWRSDEELRSHYRRAKALLFPGEEDFGIVPVEMQACGGAVIGLDRGGLLETAYEGQTAVFFGDPREEALIDAIERFEERAWDPRLARESARRFSKPRFVAALSEKIEGAAAIKEAS